MNLRQDDKKDSQSTKPSIGDRLSKIHATINAKKAEIKSLEEERKNLINQDNLQVGDTFVSIIPKDTYIARHILSLSETNVTYCNILTCGIGVDGGIFTVDYTEMRRRLYQFIDDSNYKSIVFNSNDLQYIMTTINNEIQGT